MEKLKFIKVKIGSKLPARVTVRSAGLDLFSCERKIISTNINIELQVGIYGRISPRSGLSINFNINIEAN
jgi:dUTPase